MNKPNPLMLASNCVSFSIAAITAFVLSATSVLAEEGPSKEDTIAWLHDKIGHIEVPTSKRKTDLPSHIKRQSPIMHVIDFIEGGAVLRVSSGSYSTHDYCSFDQTATASLKLSDVTPSVDINNETDYEGYTFVTLRCSSGKCIDGSKRLLAACGEGVEEVNSVISWSEGGFYVPTPVAERVQKALSHLITLSGGKEKASEDLF